MIPYVPSAVLSTCKQQFDILHILKIIPFSVFPGYALSFLKGSLPFVLDCDDWDSLVMRDEGCPSYVYTPVSLLERHLPKYCNGALAASFFLKKQLLENGVPEHRILYIPNGVDVQKYNPEAVNGLAIRDLYGIDCPTVVYVGFFNKSSERDILLLIRAAKILKDRGENLKYFLVGTGTSVPSLKKLVESLDLAKNFIFTGFRDPASFIAAADIAIISYMDTAIHRAVSSQKMFEYMAMEKAVVATEVGDLPYHVDYGKAGLLAKSNDPLDLANKILILAHDEKLRKSLGKAARERVMEYYSWENLAKKVLSFYKIIVESRFN
jgi:glycosyltransferase involved in cell wall biosynthesis